MYNSDCGTYISGNVTRICPAFLYVCGMLSLLIHFIHLILNLAIIKWRVETVKKDLRF